MEVVARGLAPGPNRSPPLGDAEFERLLQRHAPGIAALMRRRVARFDRREDAAQEALQEALARAWRMRAKFDATRSFGPWLAKVALRVALDLERARRRRPDGSDAREPTEDELAGEADDPAAELAKKEEAERLARAIERLPALPRAILLRFHRDGASVQQIAEERGLPLNTVKSHLRRARLRLARELEE